MFACSCTKRILSHVKSWKLSTISDWKTAKTCLAYDNWQDLPHLGNLPSGRIGKTGSTSQTPVSYRTLHKFAQRGCSPR
ncbi:hypothetical protein Y032_0067g49 [Ancylostoma ceylanicum]|uniref:Uncharacterized protein n=1 Tax=Ancylostoma ceylanicum TaxID=53326 RepID=A0A016U043_9BILA|nr:hypothetical protein Y032_0067g49 [Ancylostoma ceylanicum]